MNKREYLYQLERYLQEFPRDEVKDILSDYEEHFHVGISKGKTEEEISKELGNPKDIAKTYKASYRDDTSRIENYDAPPNTNDNTRRLLMGILLIFLNLIIVLGPFLAIAGLLLAGYIIGISFIIAGFFVFTGSSVVLLTPIPAPHILTSLSFGLGFIALGILGLILAVYLSKLFIQLTVKYGRWNLELINGQGVK